MHIILLKRQRKQFLLAETEDRSGGWIQEKYIPKFEVCKYGDKYGFSLYIAEEDSIVRLEEFDKLSSCLTRLDKVKENIGTTVIYMSVDKLGGTGYKKCGEISEKPTEEELVEEEVVGEEIVEECVVEEFIIEEPELPKKYIVGIVWPESSNPDRIYRYNAGETSVEVGDIVVTTLTKERLCVRLAWYVLSVTKKAKISFCLKKQSFMWKRKPKH